MPRTVVHVSDWCAVSNRCVRGEGTVCQEGKEAVGKSRAPALAIFFHQEANLTVATGHLYIHFP